MLISILVLHLNFNPPGERAYDHGIDNIIMLTGLGGEGGLRQDPLHELRRLQEEV